MRSLFRRFIVTLFMLLIVCYLVACSLWKPIAKTVIDAVVATCVSEHPEINDEPAMREVCKYAPDVAPIVKDMIGARKRGLARVSSQRDADAGAADAGK